MDSNVPDTPVGYGRIVCVMQAEIPVTGSITIRDTGGTQYVLNAHEPGSAPNCYFVAYGTYTVVGLENCTTNSNWGNLAVGNTFTVAGSTGYIGFTYTGTVPSPSIIMASGTDDNIPPAKLGYITMKVYGIGANGTVILADSDGKEYSVVNYTAHKGGAHYYYIKTGTYTVKFAGTDGNYIYINNDGTKSYLSVGVSFTIQSSNVSIVFSTVPI